LWNKYTGTKEMNKLSSSLIPSLVVDKIDKLAFATCERPTYTHYISLPPYAGALPFIETVTPPDFLNERPAAKRTLSRSEATVSTPPIMAHVLSVNVSWVADDYEMRKHTT
jgi:hypothetical protein